VIGNIEVRNRDNFVAVTGDCPLAVSATFSRLTNPYYYDTSYTPVADIHSFTAYDSDNNEINITNIDQGILVTFTYDPDVLAALGKTPLDRTLRSERHLYFNSYLIRNDSDLRVCGRRRSMGSRWYCSLTCSSNLT
jgi:hypothetical protein